MKELVEAHLLYAFITDGRLATPDELAVTGATYLKGLTEAATEMRRFALDLMRQDRVEEAAPFLTMMDEIYSLLLTVDFADAIHRGAAAADRCAAGRSGTHARRSDDGDAPGDDAGRAAPGRGAARVAAVFSNTIVASVAAVTKDQELKTQNHEKRSFLRPCQRYWRVELLPARLVAGPGAEGAA